MLLDIQKLSEDRQGGLSGLAKKILGVGLNKTRRNSNWEQRPLSWHQLEYAALDAAVLIHIFRHVSSHSQLAGVSEGHEKIEWKSHIVPHLQNQKRTTMESRSRE
uniref:3'-5' exonuclease domain-containing protein n=1 Tax=Rhizophora mucronata TaxID=61149 RepID=A0A2P2QDE1_RHIMU